MSTFYKIFILMTIMTISSIHYEVIAQSSHIKIIKDLNYRQRVTPIVLDNYLFSTFYSTGKHAYNLKGFEIAKTSDDIIDIKVSPSGGFYTLLTSNRKTNKLYIYDTWKAQKMIYKFDNKTNPSSITYSADSRFLYIADKNGLMKKYDTKSYRIIDQWSIPAIITKMETSNNDYFIAAIAGNNVYIINPERKNIRTTLSFNSPVRDIAFAKDASILATVTQNGDIDVFNTRDFKKSRQTIARSGCTSISIHPENKYIAIAADGNKIELINIIDNTGDILIKENANHTNFIRFLQDAQKNTYLTFNATNSIKYKLIQGLTPNYSKMLREEVTARMEEWSKMNPNESQEEYLKRVNDESRKKQIRLFEEEIATRMADNLIMQSNISLGDYNPKNQILTIEFDNMPPVYLTVPEKDMQNFMNVSDLEFQNAIYGVTPDDKFELVYVDIYNRQTGKTYKFNNRDRHSLDFLHISDDFVPIELVQQTGMEEIKLTGIRNEIVKEAMQNQFISDHTNIDVSTSLVTDIDASGRKITNYKINFKYSVDAAFSTKDDFPAGKYDIKASHAANSMLKIITEAFENDFAQYIKQNKKVIIKITGSADAIPVTGSIAYNGIYGDYINEPYTLGEDLSTITVTKRGGIKDNKQLAFMRAIAVQNYIMSHIKSLDVMDTDYRYSVEVSEHKGSEYRRIKVEFTFIDAF